MWELRAFTGSATKLRNHGALEYRLWIDAEGRLYVQIVNNDQSGTFSRCAFSVAKYMTARDRADPLNRLVGRNIETGNEELLRDNNNGAFLKAVLKHLFDEGISHDTH